MNGLTKTPAGQIHAASGLGRLGLLLAIVVGLGTVAGLFLLAGGDFGTVMREIDQMQGLAEDGPQLPDDLSVIPGRIGEFIAEADPVFQELADSLQISYQPPRRVAFRNRATSECFEFQSVAGPFYCFAEECLYLESDFFDEMVVYSSEAAELAQLYVVGRLMGKHLQTRMGVTDRARTREFEIRPVERLRQQTQLELQADYFAGVWAHHSSRFRQLVKEGSLEDAFRVVEEVAQERLRSCRDDGGIVAEKYDYASLEQRLKWFRLGLESGDPAEHDPFKTKNL